MKIGVISDSHGDTGAVKRAINLMGKVDLIIHLGDFCRDGERASKELGVEIISVKGNCDFGLDAEDEKIIEAGGKRLLLTHGHKYNVKYDYMDICYKAMEAEVDVCLFGHTHFGEVFEENNIVFFNPGSLSRPRNGIESFGILNIEGGNITANIISMD